MLFELEDVTKAYGRIKALDGLSVSMPKGAIGLLGPNGAGKTTMIRTLLGLIHPSAGRGKVLGRDIRSERLDIRQVCGFVPENECLFPSVDGIGFVSYAGELAGMPITAAMQRAHEVLDYVGLGEARYRQVDTYSTGMKQRAKLAAAIVHDPQLLILDEPTNGMDPAGRVEIIELARDLAHEKGMSVLFSSHLLPDVEEVCDHVMVMGRGRLLASGLIKELKAPSDRVMEVRVKHDQQKFAERLRAGGRNVEPALENLCVELAEGEDVSAVWRMAAEAGEQVRYLRPRRSTLEEVFLRAVRETGQVAS